MKRLLLGVNIDHVASLRQLRGGSVPDLVAAARMCEDAGADSVVVHLREDRRHVQDADVRMLRARVRTRLNLEMSVAPDIVALACDVHPDQVTLVPEKRKELTTEGGLDVVRNSSKIARVIALMTAKKIPVSLFVEPDEKQIVCARDTGARMVELHTGHYAQAASASARRLALKRLKSAAQYSHRLGLVVHAGHGLDYDNVSDVARIGLFHELNIGYAIICRAVSVGLSAAVRQMKKSMSIGVRLS
jgi:pyridoxine 5-phosphate synthase